DLHREHLPRARAGQVLRDQHPGSRLPDDHGAAAAGGGGVVSGLSHHRYSLHDCRPARAAGEEQVMTTSTSLAPGQPVNTQQELRQRTLLGDAARRFARNKLALVGLFIVTALILTAIFADFIAPFPYDAADPVNALQFPSSAHWMG